MFIVETWSALKMWWRRDHPPKSFEKLRLNPRYRLVVIEEEAALIFLGEHDHKVLEGEDMLAVLPWIAAPSVPEGPFPHRAAVSAERTATLLAQMLRDDLLESCTHDP